MRSSRSNGNYFLFAFMIFLILGLTGVVIWMGLSNPKSSTVEPTLPALVQAKVKISNNTALYIPITGQAVGLQPGDVIAMIPFESTSSEGYLSIIKREANMFPNAGELGWNRPSIVNVEFIDEAGQTIVGFEFDKPIEICFVLSNESWQDFIHNRDNYQIQLYKDNPVNWKSLPQAFHYDLHQLCGLSKHLSLFALAVRGELQATGTPTDIYVP